ncbi:MAG: hypothetical protein OCD02_20995 [Spirochaetaceae bacterium]
MKLILYKAIMNNIFGVVSSIPYYYIDVFGNYIFKFKIQVDKKIYINGEITVKIISSQGINLKIGSKIIVYGSINIEQGILLKATSYIKLPY